MKTKLIFLTSFIFLFFNVDAKPNDIVIETKKIHIDGFPDAWNPSFIKTDYGFLLTFRHCLTPTHPWVSYIGIVKLDHQFNPISTPQLLNTRGEEDKTPSQAEDARIFTIGLNVYVMYNDNMTVVNPSAKQRRDIYIAELQETSDGFYLHPPIKITHTQKYSSVTWQKNWVPFEWNNQLLLDYLRKPHEILTCDLITGDAHPIFETRNDIEWRWGMVRGGTPALLVDGEYLSFFHSPSFTKSTVSNGISMYHYFMGAYTFSANPPFHITKISRSPIIGDDFYNESSYDKRVIFPGGFTIANDKFYMVYGKDDSEIWVATINKQKLMKSLKKVHKK